MHEILETPVLEGEGPSTCPCYNELAQVLSRAVSTEPVVTHDPFLAPLASLYERGRVRRLQGPQGKSWRKRSM